LRCSVLRTAAGADRWASNGATSASISMPDQQNLCRAHVPQEHVPPSAKAPLFDHTVKYTPRESGAVSPEPFGMHLPEDLLELTSSISHSSKHKVCSTASNPVTIIRVLALLSVVEPRM
jgi:hypothetical protein